MSRKPPIIEVDGLGRRFSKTGNEPKYFSRLLRRTLSDAGAPPANDTFWALRNVSFHLETGDSLGIIGHNGAGKSTLLKIMSRIVPPTEGRIVLRGRVNSLLEVGTGFQKDLSGRSNIFLNASILGMSRAETQGVFDDIVEFSGLRDFIDMPVKHYSSGMYSRLAFAVAANVTGDILILDEVLAVGDAAFRKKCITRMGELLGGGSRTILFVSHNTGAILNFCNKVLWLDQGQVRAFGDAELVVTEYLKSVNTLASGYRAPAGKKENSAAKPVVVAEPVAAPAKRLVTDDAPHEPAVGANVVSLRLLDVAGEPKEVFRRTEPIRLEITYRICNASIPIIPVFHLHCAPRNGVPEEAHVFSGSDENTARPRVAGVYVSIAEIPPKLLISGTFMFSVALVTPSRPLVRHARLMRALACQVIDPEAYNVFPGERRGVIRPEIKWSTGASELEIDGEAIAS